MLNKIDKFGSILRSKLGSNNINKLKSEYNLTRDDYAGLIFLESEENGISCCFKKGHLASINFHNEGKDGFKKFKGFDNDLNFDLTEKEIKSLFGKPTFLSFYQKGLKRTEKFQHKGNFICFGYKEDGQIELICLTAE